jgi:hypothetical protein
VPVDPLFQAALAELEAAIAQTGTSEDLEPAAIKVRTAAETGDRLGVSEQLVFLRNQVQALRQTGELPEPSAERLLAAIFGVDLQLGKVIPPSPLSPISPSPSSLLEL